MFVVLTMLLSVVPVNYAVFAASETDYYARNFMATDNGIFWEGCAQISWFNPAEAPQKVSLYASGPVQTEGSYVLLGDSYDTTANASVVTTLPTKNWEVTPRNGWYNFKLVFEFAGGKSTEQTLDYYVPDLGSGDWSYETAVSNDLRTIAQRGGWCYGNPAGNNYDYFPMGSEVVYKDGNPALKIWSNGHILDGTDETRDGKTNNSGNYFGRLQLANNLASDTSKAYDISFRYQAKGIENLSLELNGASQMSLQDTGGEWASFSQTNVPYTCPAYIGSLFSFLFKVGNEELIIDDVVVKETGTDINLVSDGDFSALAAAAPADVSDAMMMYNDGNAVLTWTDSPEAQGVNIYRTTNETAVKVAYVRNTKQTVTVKGSESDTFVLKAVNAKGVEVNGTACGVRQISGADIAAIDPIATSTGYSGKIMISWRNANSNSLARVALMGPDGALIDNTFSTDSGAFCYKIIEGLDDYTYYTYTLVTEDNSGNKVEQLITGVSVPLGADEWTVTDEITSKVNVTRHKGNGSVAPIHPEVISDGSNTYLKVLNDGLKYWDNDANAEVDPLQSASGFIQPKYTLAPNTTYTLSYKIKGALPSWAKIWIYDYSVTCRQEWANAGGVVQFSDWTTKEHTFTTPATDRARDIDFELNGIANGLPVYIDDIVITSGGETVYSENFEGTEITCPSAVTDIKVTPKEDSAVFNYTVSDLNEESAKFIRIYAETEGNIYLAATLPPYKKSCEIKTLNPNGQYRFTFDVIAEGGNVSAKTAVDSVITPAYKVDAFSLTDESGNPVTAGTITAGNYVLKTKVTNNSVGDEFKAQLIVALYDGISFKCAAFSPVKAVEQGNYAELTATISVPDTQGDYKIKAFVWSDLFKMKPLCEHQTFFD